MQINFSKRSDQKELLDQPEINTAQLYLNLKELSFINTYLGGHHTTFEGINFLLKNKCRNEKITIAEIGCGGSDHLFFLHQKLKKRFSKLHFIGIDLNQDCINFSTSNRPSDMSAELVCRPYQEHFFSENDKPDILFSSLFCHHFSNEELKKQLHWMRENSKLGFVINDLHRHWFAYYSIKFLTFFFSKSELVKNDAPLSVLRGFKKKEWENIFNAAKIIRPYIQWKWAFRHLIISQNPT